MKLGRLGGKSVQEIRPRETAKYPERHCWTGRIKVGPGEARDEARTRREARRRLADRVAGSRVPLHPAVPGGGRGGNREPQRRGRRTFATPSARNGASGREHAGQRGTVGRTRRDDRLHEELRRDAAQALRGCSACGNHGRRSRKESSCVLLIRRWSRRPASLRKFLLVGLVSSVWCDCCCGGVLLRAWNRWFHLIGRCPAVHLGTYFCEYLPHRRPPPMWSACVSEASAFAAGVGGGCVRPDHRGRVVRARV